MLTLLILIYLLFSQLICIHCVPWHLFFRVALSDLNELFYSRTWVLVQVLTLTYALCRSHLYTVLVEKMS